jgi:hypothetical protein
MNLNDFIDSALKKGLLLIGLVLIFFGEWIWLKDGLNFLMGLGLNSSQASIIWIVGIFGIVIVVLIAILLVIKIIDRFSSNVF